MKDFKNKLLYVIPLFTLLTLVGGITSLAPSDVLHMAFLASLAFYFFDSNRSMKRSVVLFLFLSLFFAYIFNNRDIERIFKITSIYGYLIVAAFLIKKRVKILTTQLIGFSLLLGLFVEQAITIIQTRDLFTNRNVAKLNVTPSTKPQIFSRGMEPLIVDSQSSRYPEILSKDLNYLGAKFPDCMQPCIYTTFYLTDSFVQIFTDRVALDSVISELAKGETTTVDEVSSNHIIFSGNSIGGRVTLPIFESSELEVKNVTGATKGGGFLGLYQFDVNQNNFMVEVGTKPKWTLIILLFWFPALLLTLILIIKSISKMLPWPLDHQ